MPRLGTVIAVHGDHAQIETSRRGICDGCSDQESCAVDGVAAQGSSDRISARNPIQASIGDRVEFDLPGHTELKVSLLVWVVPLVGLTAGAIVGASVHHLIPLDRDTATLIGLVVGTALAFGVVKIFDRKARGDTNLVPEILKILPTDSCSLPSSIDDSSSAPG
jgi:sigma-E factor negative regulatory protein RseC